MDVREDVCRGWDGIIVGRDRWEEAGTDERRPGCMGGGRDVWEEAETDGRRPGRVGGGRDAWVEAGRCGRNAWWDRWTRDA